MNQTNTTCYGTIVVQLISSIQVCLLQKSTSFTTLSLCNHTESDVTEVQASGNFTDTQMF